jgi:hypothetical protein
MQSVRLSFVAFPFLCSLVACGQVDSANDPNDAEHTNGVNGQACTTSADCGSGHVCLKTQAQSGCAPVCSGSASECGANASCGGVGVMDVDVCQPAADANAQPAAEDQPKIPCAADAECAVLQEGAICAQLQGVRDCTLPCTAEAQCDMPPLGGMRVDFMTCTADEGRPSRKACLPDLRCFSNPLVCVTTDNGGGGGTCGSFGSSCTSSAECCSTSCVYGMCQ